MENRNDSQACKRVRVEDWEARVGSQGSATKKIGKMRQNRQKEEKGKAYLNSTSLLKSMTTNLTTKGKTALNDREGKVLAGQGRAKDLFHH
jgi:hypothetical protein